MKKTIAIFLVFCATLICYGQEPTKNETTTFLSNRIKSFISSYGCEGGLFLVKKPDDYNPHNITHTTSVSEINCKLTINDEWVYQGRKCKNSFILDFSKFKDIGIENANDYSRTILFFNFGGVYNIFYVDNRPYDLSPPKFLESFEFYSLDKEMTDRMIKAFRHLAKICGSSPIEDNLFK